MMEKRSFQGTLYSSFYVICLSWFLLHTLLYFWDILIPFYLSWTSYFYYYGAFLASLLLILICIAWILCYLMFPSMSMEGSSRFIIGWASSLFAMPLYYSDMLAEPLERIEIGMLGGDLRYPSCLTASWSLFKLMTFGSYCTKAFISKDQTDSATNLFKAFRSGEAVVDQGLYVSNASGIIACFYIYVSLFVMLFEYCRSWWDNMLMVGFLYTSQIYFGTGVAFYRAKSTKLLVFVLINAVVRGVVAYYRWNANGSFYQFSGMMFYCLSMLAIFASWYSSPTSYFGRLFTPYLPDDPLLRGETVAKPEGSGTAQLRVKLE